ncbi:MAG: DUF418 domain-containing protein [Balneolaceae bacterium]
MPVSIQILVSKWWLSKFRYGPLEWIWRVSTYGRILSNPIGKWPILFFFIIHFLNS